MQSLSLINQNKESAIIISYQPMETKISAQSCIENVDDQLKCKENCELDNQLF